MVLFVQVVPWQGSWSELVYEPGGSWAPCTEGELKEELKLKWVQAEGLGFLLMRNSLAEEISRSGCKLKC